MLVIGNAADGSSICPLKHPLNLSVLIYKKVIKFKGNFQLTF